MVISESEKKVLLERLALARIAKQQKKEIKEKEAKAISGAVSAPNDVPAPSEPIPIPVQGTSRAEPLCPEVVAPVVPVVPAIPDLVAAHKKGKKKVCLPDDSDSEDEAVLPPKKKKVAQKETAYMKIKIYREPKNTAAMQDLLAAVQDDEVADVPIIPEPQQPQAFVRPPRLLVQQVGGKAVKTFDSDAARKDLLRRQAMEFFA
jgi:hypothetical protein